MTCHYHDYYIGQAGSGVGSIYKGAVYQKGRGFGSFLRGLFRTVFPLVKSGLKTIGKEALRSGSYFINDVVNNVPPKEAFNSRVSESVGNLKRKAETKIDDLVGSGVRKDVAANNHVRYACQSDEYRSRCDRQIFLID